MAFASKTKSAKSKGNLPDNQLVIKIPTSKGFVTLGKLGLYNESALHEKVAQLTTEQLVKLLSKAELSVQPYSNSNVEEVELLID